APDVYNASGSVANTTNNMVNPFDFGGKQTNSYGVQAAVKFADWLNFSAFGSYTNVTLIGKDNGDIWTYGGGFAFPDLGKEGNILGIFAGVQPYISGLSNRVGAVYNLPVSNPFTAELFYKYQVTDNLSLTPGVIWISNPEQTTGSTNGSVIGTLRGTFTF
ncbi:MAG: carbohydrate porin, partial [Microcystaceae cyanobacterium]